LVSDYRAEDRLDDASAGRVRDVHGVEPLPQRGVRCGVAAAATAAAPAVSGAEAQRPVQRHRRPCKNQTIQNASSRRGEKPEEAIGAHARRCTAGVRARPAATTRRRGSNSSRGGGRASGARAPRLETSSSVAAVLRPLGAPTAPSGTGMAEPRRVGEQVHLLEDQGGQEAALAAWHVRVDQVGV
jgi:hypothetical protein